MSSSSSSTPSVDGALLLASGNKTPSVMHSGSFQQHPSISPESSAFVMSNVAGSAAPPYSPGSVPGPVIPEVGSVPIQSMAAVEIGQGAQVDADDLLGRSTPLKKKPTKREASAAAVAAAAAAAVPRPAFVPLENHEIQAKLDSNGVLLQEWAALLETGDKSTETAVSHANYKRKIQENLTLLAKHIEYQIKPKAQKTAPTSSNGVAAAAAIPSPSPAPVAVSAASAAAAPRVPLPAASQVPVVPTAVATSARPAAATTARSLPSVAPLVASSSVPSAYIPNNMNRGAVAVSSAGAGLVQSIPPSQPQSQSSPIASQVPVAATTTSQSVTAIRTQQQQQQTS